jgi:hypothetical protein
VLDLGLDVFKEDPPIEAAALGALAARFGHDALPANFALGQALLELAAQQRTFVPLPEVSVPYAATLCKHLQVEDRQCTSAQSHFLDARRNRGDLDAEQLAAATVRLGFANVIDAFHVSRGGQPTQTRFFVDERAGRQGITLTDHLLELANGQQAKILPLEGDARWNLVQMSWGLRLGTRLVSFEMAPDKEAVDLCAPARLRRGPITGVRTALSGYQDGHCAELSISRPCRRGRWSPLSSAGLPSAPSG